MTKFEDILNMNSDDIKPPAVLPMGSYHTVLIGLPEQGESSKKKTPFLKFQHKIVAAMDDVDPDALAEFQAEGETVSGQVIDNTFYITEKSANMLKEFMVNCGLEMSGRSMAEAIDDLPNREVGIHIKHEASEDGKRVFSKIGSTFRIES
jgi:hypothetical protein